MKLQSGLASISVGFALLISAPAWAVETFTHDQTSLDYETIGSVANSENFRVEQLQVTVTNSTLKTWKDYHFKLIIVGESPGDFVEVVRLTVPAAPFESGSRSKSAGSTTFDMANFFNGSLAPGGSFTANFDFNHRSSVDIKGRPSLRGGAVPEPATWAMTILGFGLAGARMRRRDRRVPTSV